MSVRTWLFGLNKKERKEIYELFVEALKDTVVELEPDGRYLLIIPESLNISDVAEEIIDALDLANTPLRFVVVQGDNISLLSMT